MFGKFDLVWTKSLEKRNFSVEVKSHALIPLHEMYVAKVFLMAIFWVVVFLHCVHTNYTSQGLYYSIWATLFADAKALAGLTINQYLQVVWHWQVVESAVVKMPNPDLIQCLCRTTVGVLEEQAMQHQNLDQLLVCDVFDKAIIHYRLTCLALNHVN